MNFGLQLKCKYLKMNNSTSISPVLQRFKRGNTKTLNTQIQTSSTLVTDVRAYRTKRIPFEQIFRHCNRRKAPVSSH